MNHFTLDELFQSPHSIGDFTVLGLFFDTNMTYYHVHCPMPPVLGTSFFLIVPGRGSFQLSDLAGLGYELGFWLVFP